METMKNELFGSFEIMEFCNVYYFCCIGREMEVVGINFFMIYFLVVVFVIVSYSYGIRVAI